MMQKNLLINLHDGLRYGLFALAFFLCIGINHVMAADLLETITALEKKEDPSCVKPKVSAKAAVRKAKKQPTKKKVKSPLVVWNDSSSQVYTPKEQRCLWSVVRKLACGSVRNVKLTGDTSQEVELELSWVGAPLTLGERLAILPHTPNDASGSHSISTAPREPRAAPMQYPYILSRIEKDTYYLTKNDINQPTRELSASAKVEEKAPPIVIRLSDNDYWYSYAQANFVAGLRAEEDVYSGQISWNPTHYLGGQSYLRGNLGLSLFRADSASKFIVLDVHALIGVWSGRMAWEGGLGLQTWVGHEPINPVIVFNAAILSPFKSYPVLERIFGGYAGFFGSGGYVHQLKVGVGFCVSDF